MCTVKVTDNFSIADVKARLEILKVHAKKIKMNEGMLIFLENKEVGICNIPGLKGPLDCQYKLLSR